MMLRICARKDSDSPSPAASSAARVIRRPDERRSTERPNWLVLTDKFRWAEIDAGLLLIINAMDASSLPTAVLCVLRFRVHAEASYPAAPSARLHPLSEDTLKT
ncbi:MAG: hypothetical protein LZF86_100101 [Nitrospira sp.]|nr:MAG: hypothetical protein LZF86_100101 [Nitrospira sp.]